MTDQQPIAVGTSLQLTHPGTGHWDDVAGHLSGALAATEAGPMPETRTAAEAHTSSAPSPRHRPREAR
jgi:hypothetical protein